MKELSLSQDEQVQVISPTFYDRQLPYAKLPRNNTDVWIGNFPNIPYLRVCWNSIARFQVLRHAYRMPEYEVGGVLIGGVYRSGSKERYGFNKETWGDADFPIDFIQILYSLPAEQSSYTSGQFNFTEKAWAEMNATLDHMVRDGTLLNDSRIVGWYHTHPGHGLSLGGHDLFIHNNYFSSEFQMALVIETKQQEGAFYVDSARIGGPFRSEKFIWDRRFLSVQDNPVLPASFTRDREADIKINIIEQAGKDVAIKTSDPVQSPKGD
jgi:proteasome lid subunit RPN8/RPN11